MNADDIKIDMEHSKIIQSIQAGQLAPIYFLHGEESYFIDIVSDYIEDNVLDEASKAFNQIVLYGKETEFKQVLDQAMQFPMMASHRVVIVKEAQSMKGFENLLSYFQNPSEQTVLVIAHKHKSFDKRKKKLWDAIKKNAVILESKKLYDNQIPNYIISIAEENKLQISNKTAFILAEHLGNDLSKITNEINKLKLNLPEGSEVTLDHVQKHIGISKDYNVFEFQKAIGEKNKLKAYSIARYFAENKKAHPIQMNMGSLYNYLSKLFIAKKYEKSDDRTFAQKAKINPYFAKEYKSAARHYTMPQIARAFASLHKMDKASKGVETRRIDDLALYQEFLFQLFED